MGVRYSLILLSLGVMLTLKDIFAGRGVSKRVNSKLLKMFLHPLFCCLFWLFLSFSLFTLHNRKKVSFVGYFTLQLFQRLLQLLSKGNVTLNEFERGQGKKISLFFKSSKGVTRGENIYCKSTTRTYGSHSEDMCGRLAPNSTG